MDVASLHEAEHLPGVTADVEGLPVELTLERIERPHDVADGLVAVHGGVLRLRPVGQVEDAGVGLGHHLLAVVDPDKVLLKDVVVEHVLGRFTQVDDPLTQGRRVDPVGHVLVVDGTGGVVVPADAADPAGDEVGVAGVLALHEDGVATEHRRGAVALHHGLVGPVDLGVDAQAPDDARDRVPGHLHDVAGRLRHAYDAPFLRGTPPYPRVTTMAGTRS
jgi:hypothetical protein